MGKFKVGDRVLYSKNKRKVFESGVIVDCRYCATYPYVVQYENALQAYKEEDIELDINYIQGLIWNIK